MAAIRSKNTKPEIFVRKYLHKNGFRFRLHPDLSGRPDIVLRKYNAVIWIHGCFWHGHNCSYFRMPRTRRVFWEEKISGNRARDARAVQRLKADGWRQLIVWECSLKGKRPEQTLKRIGKWIVSKRRLTEF
jgi:DNA mismatch endonuclease (patch repair protein)